MIYIVPSTDRDLSLKSSQKILDLFPDEDICFIETKQKTDKLTEKLLFAKYPEVDWKGAMGMRDIIAHHYFDLDAAVVYDVVKNYLPFMLATIKKIRKEL